MLDLGLALGFAVLKGRAGSVGELAKFLRSTEVPERQKFLILGDPLMHKAGGSVLVQVARKLASDIDSGAAEPVNAGPALGMLHAQCLSSRDARLRNKAVLEIGRVLSLPGVPDPIKFMLATQLRIMVLAKVLPEHEFNLLAGDQAYDSVLRPTPEPSGQGEPPTTPEPAELPAAKLKSSPAKAESSLLRQRQPQRTRSISETFTLNLQTSTAAMAPSEVSPNSSKSSSRWTPESQTGNRSPGAFPGRSPGSPSLASPNPDLERKSSVRDLENIARTLEDPMTGKPMVDALQYLDQRKDAQLHRLKQHSTENFQKRLGLGSDDGALTDDEAAVLYEADPSGRQTPSESRANFGVPWTTLDEGDLEDQRSPEQIEFKTKRKETIMDAYSFNQLARRILERSPILSAVLRQCAASALQSADASKNLKELEPAEHLLAYYKPMVIAIGSDRAVRRKGDFEAMLGMADMLGMHREQLIGQHSRPSTPRKEQFNPLYSEFERSLEEDMKSLPTSGDVNVDRNLVGEDLGEWAKFRAVLKLAGVSPNSKEADQLLDEWEEYGRRQEVASGSPRSQGTSPHLFFAEMQRSEQMQSSEEFFQASPDSQQESPASSRGLRTPSIVISEHAGSASSSHVSSPDRPRPSFFRMQTIPMVTHHEDDEHTVDAVPANFQPRLMSDSPASTSTSDSNDLFNLRLNKGASDQGKEERSADDAVAAGPPQLTNEFRPGTEKSEESEELFMVPLRRGSSN